jgi:hypothetical protein
MDSWPSFVHILLLPLRDAQVPSIPLCQAASSRSDRGQSGRDGAPAPSGPHSQYCRCLHLYSVSLLAANSAKLTYILSCLDGVIDTLILNCLKVLVVRHSNTSYKTICRRNYADCSKKVMAKSSPAPIP